MSRSTFGAVYTFQAASPMNRAWSSGVTPKTSGGFVWYAYSVSQMRADGNACPTSLSRRSSVAMVIVLQEHPPASGVSPG